MLKLYEKQISRYTDIGRFSRERELLLIMPVPSEDILLVFLFTIDRTITVICNDESQARNQFEEIIVKPVDCFEDYDHELTFSQAWTLDDRVVRIFYDAIGLSDPSTFTNL